MKVRKAWTKKLTGAATYERIGDELLFGAKVNLCKNRNVRYENYSRSGCIHRRFLFGRRETRCPIEFVYLKRRGMENSRGSNKYRVDNRVPMRVHEKKGAKRGRGPEGTSSRCPEHSSGGRD